MSAEGYVGAGLGGAFVPITILAADSSGAAKGIFGTAAALAGAGAVGIAAHAAYKHGLFGASAGDSVTQSEKSEDAASSYSSERSSTLFRPRA